MSRSRGHEAPLDHHRRMLADPHRMDAYERAIRRLVRPGDVVLDLGAGTGILAMLAARAGAARVHAVESMPIARLAADLVRENRLGDRVTVHEADATSLAPVERRTRWCRISSARRVPGVVAPGAGVPRARLLRRGRAPDGAYYRAIYEATFGPFPG